MKILLVEDEWLIRAVGADTLIDAGFEVLEAQNADEAVRILENAGEVHVLFTDIRMPGSMNGLELAQVVHERWPAVKLLLTSGDTWPGEREIPDQGRFLPKPYKLDRLVNEVDNLIGK